MKLAIAVVAVVLAMACRNLPAPDEPGATALRLFAVPEAERIALFEIDPARRGQGRLLDAVSRLNDAKEPRVVATTSLEHGNRAIVDVTAKLLADGTASYSVALHRDAEGHWRIDAFWGPGVAWPERPAVPADGLSVSPPPR